MSQVSKDIIVLPEFTEAVPVRWVVMNVLARTCLGVNSEVLGFISFVEQLPSDELSQRFAGEIFQIWDIERFSIYDGLLCDPTPYVRNVNQWGNPQIVDSVALMEKLKQHCFVIDDVVEYRQRFQAKTSLRDKEHFGNLHQQLGQELLLKRHESPSQWWLRQKFSEDLRSVRMDNLYGAVQAHYLETYFPRKLSPGMTVVDIGCGTGFYANMMARCGAQVLGVDPNPDYIEAARKNALSNTRFEVKDMSYPDALRDIPDGYADVVYISDTLLFYFVPTSPDQGSDVCGLLQDIHRILKPDGTFISLEPHFVFWTAPWLGEPDHPFTIITEYMNKNFGVTGILSQLIQSLTKAGFVVTWMEELTPDPAFASVNPRAYHIAREFPVWHLFESKKAHFYYK